LYGVEILTDDYFILSQYMHLTDGWTELQQQYRALHYMQSHGKNHSAVIEVMITKL